MILTKWAFDEQHNLLVYLILRVTRSFRWHGNLCVVMTRLLIIFIIAYLSPYRFWQIGILDSSPHQSTIDYWSEWCNNLENNIVKSGISRTRNTKSLSLDNVKQQQSTQQQSKDKEKSAFYDWRKWLKTKETQTFCFQLLRKINFSVLTGTRSGYFRRILSPSAFLFSNACSILYWNFIFTAKFKETSTHYYKLRLNGLSLAEGPDSCICASERASCECCVSDNDSWNRVYSEA
jgi:hypothetical protein